jgi:protein-L-isoaspartate(D-aspartate) O-methyltransferase
MAEVVGASGSVVGSEVHAELGARAKGNLAGYKNVSVEIREENAAPFDPGECDAIFVNAGMMHILPMWLDRLREGGRMLVPLTASVNPGIGHGAMAKIARSGGLFTAETTGAVNIFSAVGLRDPSFEESIQAAFKSQKLSGMKSVRRDAHEPTDTCILHVLGGCLSSVEIVGAESVDAASR